MFTYQNHEKNTKNESDYLEIVAHNSSALSEYITKHMRTQVDNKTNESNKNRKKNV